MLHNCLPMIQVYIMCGSINIICHNVKLFFLLNFYVPSIKRTHDYMQFYMCSHAVQWHCYNLIHFGTSLATHLLSNLKSVRYRSHCQLLFQSISKDGSPFSSNMQTLCHIMFPFATKQTNKSPNTTVSSFIRCR